MRETDCEKFSKPLRVGKNNLKKTTITQNQMNEKFQNKYRLGHQVQHQTVWELLPWFVNDTLKSVERDMASEHLNSCLICRRELGALTSLADAVLQRVEDVGCEQALASLHDRIDEQPESSKIPWAVAASLMLMIGLALITSNKVTDGLRDFGGGFQTLGTPPATGPNRFNRSARVVFHQDFDATEMVSLLDSVDATIATGPSRRGTFTIEFASTTSSKDQQFAISVLRSSDHVLLVEPVALTINERLYR